MRFNFMLSQENASLNQRLMQSDNLRSKLPNLSYTDRRTKNVGCGGHHPL